MSAGAATWFPGPDGVPMFGSWHVPAAGARGLAILCGTIGDEQYVVHRAYRLLADALVAKGVAVLRYDHPGEGDSGDPADPGGSWVTGVGSAVAAAREAGAEHVTLVAIRFGAVIATEAIAAGVGVDSLVLRDPLSGGPAFLRHLRALHLVAGNHAGTQAAVPAVEGAVEGPGTYLVPAAARHARSLRLREVPAGLPTLWVTRAEVRGEALIHEEALIHRMRTSEQEDFIDVSRLHATLPRSTIRDIAAWIGDRPPTTFAPCAPVGAPSVTLHGPGGDVEESIVALGPRRLAGIVTTPLLATSTGTVVFADTATTYHPGPGRLWTALARSLAAQGFRAVRFDYADLGDSPDATRGDGPRYYVESCARDIADAVGDLPPGPGPGLALVGHCSGAWAVGRAGMKVHVDAVYLVNPMIWSARPRPQGPGGDDRATVTGALLYRTRARPRARTVVRLVWSSLATARLVASAGRFVRALTSTGTRITTLLGVEERERLELHLAWGEVRALEADPLVRVRQLDHTDHALKTRDIREYVSEHLPTWLAEDLADAAERVGQTRGSSGDSRW